MTLNMKVAQSVETDENPVVCPSAVDTLIANKNRLIVFHPGQFASKSNRNAKTGLINRVIVEPVLKSCRK